MNLILSSDPACNIFLSILWHKQDYPGSGTGMWHSSQ